MLPSAPVPVTWDDGAGGGAAGIGSSSLLSSLLSAGTDKVKLSKVLNHHHKLL